MPPLIFADATTFTIGKSISSLPGDVIGIELSPIERSLMRHTKRHFQNFIPSNYIVFDKNHRPRYSSFKCKIHVDGNDFIPIELKAITQTRLFEMVTEFREEVSGLLSDDGIHNLKTGSPTKAPIQPDRTTTNIPFHTHPVKTYEMFNVNYGLPSSSDLKYLYSKPLARNVFNAHLLPSREGIYAIAKKTCNNVPKKTLDKDQFHNILTDCSFILLPWNFNRSWFIF